ncbi:putative serine incorporator [Iris pallida]|uniref:Serine incorporator n=1 Tax=Iris pallida TaxID=29817 RepID=A0AAX6GDE2_IRIPA|nr:putative serine incorporator [Iris pallida]
MTNQDMDMEDPSSSNSHRERYARFMEDSCCTHFCVGPNPSMARYVYGLIFLITSLLAWTIRDYGHNALSELERLKGCHGAHYCLGAEGVLRISFGSFIFFLVMFLSTAGTKQLKDPRSSWHSEWWAAKIILWMGLMTIPFFIPMAFIDLYGRIARFGAGVFLVIQLISVISFITWFNDCCRSEKNADRCRIQVTVVSVTAYAASIVGIILMYVWYASKPECRLNILFITTTLVLLQLITFVSLHSKVKAGFLAPGLMGVYIVFLCWTGIRSEPRTEICNRKALDATNADWLTIMCFIIAILVIAMATFSTGIDSKCFQFKKTESALQDDVPYGYGFFHLFLPWEQCTLECYS